MGRTFVSIGGCSWASGGERLIRPGMKRVPKVVGPRSLQHTESSPKGIKPMSVMDEKLLTGYPRWATTIQCRLPQYFTHFFP